MPGPVRYRSSDGVRTATARIATLQRKDRPEDPEALADARDQLLAAKLERAIFEALHPEPPYEPLSDKRRKPLIKALRG